MSDFVTLSCPNCGGKLQVTPDIDRFACSHCGVEQIVKRGEGIISLSPVMDAIAKVQSSVDVIAEDIKFRKEQKAKIQEKIAEEMRLRREQEAKEKEKIASEQAVIRLKSEIEDLQNSLHKLQNKKIDKAMINWFIGATICGVIAIGTIFASQFSSSAIAWIGVIICIGLGISEKNRAKSKSENIKTLIIKIKARQAQFKQLNSQIKNIEHTGA